MKDHKLSFSPCSMVSKLDEERLCLCPLMKLLTNNLLKSSKDVTVFKGILLNHTRAGPLRVVGKTLHIISSETPWRCMVVLKVAMWSNGSRVPSYESKEGILNFKRWSSNAKNSFPSHRRRQLMNPVISVGWKSRVLMSLWLNPKKTNKKLEETGGSRPRTLR